MPANLPDTLRAAGRAYRYVNVDRTLTGRTSDEAILGLPLSLRIFAENVLRRVDVSDREALLEALVRRDRSVDITYYPSRVVLQDLLATPALADLAGLRDAVAERGADPSQVNPQVPVDLVIDHSVIVDATGRGALEQNMKLERERNAERFQFFDWSGTAFRNLRIVPPGQGILHQINLERFSPVVMSERVDGEWTAYPDTLVGTDSHTPMINALGVLGWGVGGIEAEAVMLGRGIRMRLPEIVGVRLTGALPEGALATDLALALAERLRRENVVGAILEFFGAGVATLSVFDRATVANMSPEYGATASLFAIDELTIDYLRVTGRPSELCELVQIYAKAQGMWADALRAPHYDRVIECDLSGVTRAIAGPREPHQRIPLDELGAHGGHSRTAASSGLAGGAVVIAAITSCTNTSNARAMIAAGLLARNAVARGLRPATWVKRSLAPGSRAVLGYLESAGLYEPMQALGFDVVGFGCTTCAGMSGPLAPEIEDQIRNRRLDVAAVLSGNRNFDGRIHPLVRDAFLASPPLVVAYAIAGSVNRDIQRAPLARDSEGREVFLSDVWPSDAEIDAVMRDHVQPKQFLAVYAAFSGEHAVTADSAPPLFAWNPESTYVRRPPYWEEGLARPQPLEGMRALIVLGDNVTTDHISPAGAIDPDAPAGLFLRARGVAVEDFNAYGARRGNHEVMARATFANVRLRNEMTPELEGPYTRLMPENRVTTIFDAAQTYLARREPLIVIAGRNYGCGSSRDWAAKGPRLLGVSAIVAESFERIHRFNLAGMGILPLQFEPGTSRRSLELDGSERYDVLELDTGLAPRGVLRLAITRRGGTRSTVPVTCRLDTWEEIAYFRAGGLLPLVRDELLKAPRVLT
jgi:2-methylcitrate dehydratase (2-methyl-trans-aconitate forming)